MGCTWAGAEGKWAGPADQPSISPECWEARALFRGLTIRHVEAGSALTFMGSRWGSEEPAGHTHPVPSARRPGPPPAAMCGPGEGAGLPSDRQFGWTFFPAREPGGFPVCVYAARTRVGPPPALPRHPAWPPSQPRARASGHKSAEEPSICPWLCSSLCGRLSTCGRSRDARGFSVLGHPVPGGVLAASLDSTHQCDHQERSRHGLVSLEGQSRPAEIHSSSEGSWVSRRALRPTSASPEAELGADVVAGETAWDRSLASGGFAASSP